jgi:hypothetical protein
MIDDGGTTDAMQIDMGNQILGENLPQCHFSTTNPT